MSESIKDVLKMGVIKGLLMAPLLVFLGMMFKLSTLNIVLLAVSLLAFVEYVGVVVTERILVTTAKALEESLDKAKED